MPTRVCYQRRQDDCPDPFGDDKPEQDCEHWDQQQQQVYADCRAEWDPNSGEQWVRILKTSTLLGLVWVPGPLVIETKGHREVAAEVTRVTSTYCEILVVPHMNTPILSFAANRMEKVWPDGDWPTGAVDPSAMSAYDLWYATS